MHCARARAPAVSGQLVLRCVERLLHDFAELGLEVEVGFHVIIDTLQEFLGMTVSRHRNLPPSYPVGMLPSGTTIRAGEKAGV